MSSYPAVTGPPKQLDDAADAVYLWRVRQLTHLGLAQLVAEAVADHVDWHDVAELVKRGCPAALAVTIVE